MAEQVNPGTIMYVKDWLTLGALLLGPVVTVWWTLRSQDIREKRAAKERLFMTLMAHRRSPPNLEWATALNLIDVVFSDYPKITGKWHQMYDLAMEGRAGSSTWHHAHIDLLSLMAKALGYKALEQTAIDKFYIPQAQADLNQRQLEAAVEFLRVLKASKSFSEPI